LPIAALTEQLYISGSAQGFGKEDDAGLVRLFLQGQGESAIGKSKSAPFGPTAMESLSGAAPKVAVIGLDEVGRNLAVAVAQSGFEVHVFDADDKDIQKLVASNSGVRTHKTPTAAAQAADILVLRARDMDHALDILVGPPKTAAALAPDAVVLLSSTLSPSQLRTIEDRLACAYPSIALLDSPAFYSGSSEGNRISVV
jgi:3-hydroxyisobutyrate dehydrogenase-like beta-hydroxyacid dehydrogenase